MAPRPHLSPLAAFELDGSLPPYEPTRFSSNPSFDLAFLAAARDGDLRLVKRAARTLGRGAEGRRLAEKLAAVRDGFGNGLLHAAAYAGSLPVCRYLVEDLRMDVDDVGLLMGETPFTTALATGNMELVRYFLDQGADKERLNNDGYTPLHLATGQGPEMVDLLLSKGANPDSLSHGGTVLHLAAIHGQDDIMKVLLDHHADHKLALRSTGHTALVLATISCSLKCVKLLLEYGRTPIEIAAHSGQREHVKILFPVTSRIRNVRDWSVDGVISHVKSVPLGKKTMLASAKSRAHEAFKNANYLLAAKVYDEAMELDPGNATLLSNRSLCWLRFGNGKKALEDAQACRMMRPGWAKACYREGTALMLLRDYEEACGAFLDGLKLEPGNVEMEDGLRETLVSLKISGSSTGKDYLDQQPQVDG